MKKFILYVALAVVATLPCLTVGLTGTHLPTVPTVVIFFAAILGAGFLLSWGAEAAEQHVSRGVQSGNFNPFCRRAFTNSDFKRFESVQLNVIVEH